MTTTPNTEKRYYMDSQSDSSGDWWEITDSRSTISVAGIWDTQETAQAILDFLNNREPTERKE